MVIGDNAEELAVIAEEIGDQVIRRAVPYPGREGSFEVWKVEIEQVLCEVEDQDVAPDRNARTHDFGNPCGSRFAS